MLQAEILHLRKWHRYKYDIYTTLITIRLGGSNKVDDILQGLQTTLEMNLNIGEMFKIL